MYKKILEKLKKDELIDNDLKKGSLQRKMPFNPQKDVSPQEREAVEGWGHFQDSKAKDSIPEMNPNAKKRQLIKWTSETQTKKHPETGETMYLMHRGMSGEEYNKLKEKDFNKDYLSGWTPDYNLASKFGKEGPSYQWQYDKLDQNTKKTLQNNKKKYVDVDGIRVYGKENLPRKVISAWIPESQIQHIPQTIGDSPEAEELIDNKYKQQENKKRKQKWEKKQQNNPKKKESYYDPESPIWPNAYKYQKETIIKPHKLMLESDEEREKRLSPTKPIDIINAKINAKSGVKDILGISKSENTENDLSHLNNVKINPEHGKTIAQAYHEMKHDPDHPEVQKAYSALIDETKQQFNDIMNKGLKISRIEPGMENPYKNSKELHADIKNNNHLGYFPTEQGFGGEEQSQKHPMLQGTGVKHGDKELLANDMFRIVHDINGHHIGGESGFGPTGEHKAYLTHKKMYSPLAGKALASETMGQNSWVNFGPHGEHNQKNPAQTVYAEQKAGLLPDEIVNQDWHIDSMDKTESFYDQEYLKKSLSDLIIKKSKKYPEISKNDLKKNFRTLLRNGVGLLGLVHAYHYMGQPDTAETTRVREPTAMYREVEKDKRFHPIRETYGQQSPEDFQEKVQNNQNQSIQKPTSPPRPGSQPTSRPGAISNLDIKDKTSFNKNDNIK